MSVREDIDSLFKWLVVLASVGIMGIICGIGYGIYKLVGFLMN